MKLHKNLLILGALGIVIVVVGIGVWMQKSKSSPKTIQYTLNNKSYRLYVADTPEEWEKGLMFYRTLEGADGMFFRFPTKEVRSFWNKNTYLDLDLYWLDDNRVVKVDFLPSIERSKEVVVVHSTQPVNAVVELTSSQE